MVTEEQLATDRQILGFERTVQHFNRRGFLGGMTGAIVAAALAGEAMPANAQTASAVLTVLNFALNLEYLEANFYAAASTGAVLSDPNVIGTSGVASVGAPGKLSFDAITLAVCQALAADELHHIQTLRSTITSLGGTPISQPLINLAAKGAVTTQAQFLTAARQFTAVGGAAYVGGSIMLVSNVAVLTAAAQILGAEGQHGGTLNYLCNNQGVVSPAVDALDVPPGSTTTGNAFTVYSNTAVQPNTALSPSRTPQQTLGIVYGYSTIATTTPPAGITVGGFFPNGVNGTVTST